MKDGFLRVGTAGGKLAPGCAAANADECARLAREAENKKIKLLLFPELSLVGATLGDLLSDTELINSAAAALSALLDKTRDTNVVFAVGLPIAHLGAVYNAMTVCYLGRVIGIVPKRCPEADSVFSPAPIGKESVTFLGAETPFSSDLLFNIPSLGASFSVIFGSDLLSRSPAVAALAAMSEIILSPAAIPYDYRGEKLLFDSLSAKSRDNICTVVFSCAGSYESGNDRYFGGEMGIFECGERLAKADPDGDIPELIFSEADTMTALALRRADAASRKQTGAEGFISYRTVTLDLPIEETPLSRSIDQNPFLPAGTDARSAAERIIKIQSRSLGERLRRAYSRKPVLGISGGLDSTMALIAAAHACDYLKIDRKNVIAVTLPAFGTSKKTRGNAEILSEALGVDFRTVDIKEAVSLHLRDIGYPEGEHGVTYENAQARERTQVLMDLANSEGGIVVGTGDLSELALGFATYNGDQMSMYGVNASLPKTLMRRVISEYADEMRECGKNNIADVLYDILNTPISPELLPPDADGDIAQCTEEIVGSYELHDFFIYHFIKHRATPRKLYRTACAAFSDKYESDYIKATLKIFIKRFFSSQFKRSPMPDGAAVTDISLSPREGWSMPSDMSGAAWLASLDE